MRKSTRNIILFVTGLVVIAAIYFSFDAYREFRASLEVKQMASQLFPNILNHPEIEKALGSPVTLFARTKGWRTGNFERTPFGSISHLKGSRSEGSLEIYAHETENSWVVDRIVLKLPNGTSIPISMI